MSAFVGVAPDDGIKSGGTLLPEVATEKNWKKQTGETQSVREELIQAYKTNLAQKVNSDVDISRAITEGKIEGMYRCLFKPEQGQLATQNYHICRFNDSFILSLQGMSH